jgi:hypothetical protein
MCPCTGLGRKILEIKTTMPLCKGPRFKRKFR